MQVKAEIVGKVVIFEDIFEQRFIARPEQHHVMRHIVKAFVRAKVPNKKTHRILAALNLGVCPDFAVLRVDQVLIGPGGVCIADNDVGRQCFTACKCDATSASICDFDATNFSASAQTAAHVFDQIHQAVDQSPGTAHSPVHAIASLERIDE